MLTGQHFIEIEHQHRKEEETEQHHCHTVSDGDVVDAKAIVGPGEADLIRLITN